METLRSKGGKKTIEKAAKKYKARLIICISQESNQGLVLTQLFGTVEGTNANHYTTDAQ